MGETDHYDAIVVGSGAAGGIAAFELTRGGLRVLLLEAGRDYRPGIETPMFQTPAEAPLRGAWTDDKPFGFYDATVGGGWTIPGEPYSGGDHFKWWRSRMLGGRTNHWDRVSLRFGPYDFKPRCRDGLGFDWPIDYSDVQPWYDYVERLIGVTGLAHGLENLPDSPPGVHLTPPPLRAYEVVLERAFGKLGIPVAAMRAAILTEPHDGRPACVYATSCLRGCSIRANFQTPTVLLPPALGTGQLTIRTNAIVYKVNVDKNDRATGVSFIDREAGDDCSVRAPVVVLAAGSCASTRILFNSATSRFPEGLGNSSGFLGRHVMDSTGTAARVHIPLLERISPQNDDGMHVAHIFVPWWGYEEQLRGELDFPRGYQIEFLGGWRMPNMGVGKYPAYADGAERLFGSKLRDEVVRKYGSLVIFGGEGEMIPNEHSYCELDPVEKDQWGIPTLKFHWRWSDHEKRQFAHMHKTFQDVADVLGGRVVKPGGLLDGGRMIHEVGGVKMGQSSKDSCTDKFGQLWDVKNLFVFDGGTFVSKPHKNPTLTIMALAARGSNEILARGRRGEI